MVAVRKRADIGVTLKIGAQPLLLWRALTATPDGCAVRVERDQVPRADVVRVVALGRKARGAAEVAEVLGRGSRRVAVGAAGRLVLVVSGNRVCDRLHPPPRRVVTLQIGVETAALVLV